LFNPQASRSSGQKEQSGAPAPVGVPAASGRFSALYSRNRWLVGMIVVLVVIGLQMIPHMLSSQPHSRKLFRFALWVTEMPVLMVALSAYYRRAVRLRRGSARTLVASLAISALIGALCSTGLAYVAAHHPDLGLSSGLIEGYASALVYGCVFSISQCGIWALAFVYPFAAEDARLRSLEAETLKLEAEKLRSAAELVRLRSQLEPHFLLNTLNAIAGLVTQDPREARRLLACLGDLLRDALRDPDEMQTLGEAVDWLRRYAEILESRHTNALRFHWDIADGALSARLPRLLLQPLVENAVKHGALRRSEGGQVSVRARVDPRADSDDETLVCTIEDNGPGMGDASPRSGAFGLHAVRRRLELKYERAALRLESSASGTRAIVELPYSPDPETSAVRGAPGSP
jgi:hypothetical protein